MTAPPMPPRSAEHDLEQWHRLHPLSPLVRGSRALFALLAVVAFRLLGRNGDRSGLIADAAFFGLVLVGGFVSWLVTRWRVEGADLRIETGLLRRSSQRYPLRQVQAIDVVRSGAARALGLSELRLRMAGGSAKGRLACLTDAHARALREQLLGLPTSSARVEDQAVAVALDVQPSETLLLRVATGQLVASLLLSGLGIVTVLYLLWLAAAAAFLPAGAASSVIVLLALGGAVARRFNGGYRLTVSTSPQGIHLVSGLVQTTAETVPTGRVQALRMVEPLLWRPFGWCRVEAAIAGKDARSEDRAEGARRRALLPVGSYAEAYQVIGLVLPDVAVTPTKPPARARWKAPLSYHRLSIGGNAACMVTTSGRLRRVSHWVPLEKVQSVRRTQGPVQRRLRLATVHLDTAGPRMHAALRDRDGVEADELIRELPGRCATARALSVPHLLSALVSGTGPTRLDIT